MLVPCLGLNEMVRLFSAVLKLIWKMILLSRICSVTLTFAFDELTRPENFLLKIPTENGFSDKRWDFFKVTRMISVKYFVYLTSVFYLNKEIT